MRLLHLFSNRRWTGAAEPVVNLVSALHHAGWDVTFSFGQERIGFRDGIRQNAQKRGLSIRTGLRLQKHSNLFIDYADGRRLRKWLRHDRFDIVHAHLRNAHVITAFATRPLAKRPCIIRTCYAGEGPGGARDRILLQRHTDGLIVVSELARRNAVEGLGFPADRIWCVHTPIDMDRFNPHRGLGDRRAELGIDRNAFVVGIVARIQWRRRYDVFIQAIDHARRSLPNLRAVIVGRGTHMKRIALDPIRRRGLNDVILLPGYQKGDDFVRTIATMDVKVYLVPGTDGSCRAVREAMAMNVPVIAARRGILPELLGQGRGLLVGDSPATLANAILKMAHDPGARREISRRARQYAVENFALNRQADIVAGIYHSVVKRRKR